MRLKAHPMNRKGYIFDIYFMLVALLVFAITVIISATVLGEIEKEPTFNATMTAHNATYIMQGGNDAIAGFDNLVVVFYILMNLAAVASAFLIRTHPIFFVLSILVMGFFILASAIFANIYYEVASMSFIAPYAANYPLIYTLFTYLPTACLIFSILLAVVMYGKMPGGATYGY